jgi:hypothetical protein
MIESLFGSHASVDVKIKKLIDKVLGSLCENRVPDNVLLTICFELIIVSLDTLSNLSIGGSREWSLST